MTFKLTLFLLGSILAGASAQTCPSTAQTLQDRAQPYLDAARAAGGSFVSVSSASGMPNLAADSLATAFGSDLAAQASLGGIVLQVVDSAGVSRAAQLIYVSSNQINYLIPAGTSPGIATTNIINGTGNVQSSTAPVQTVAPALFTANENGQGVVAATAIRTIAPRTEGVQIPVYQCGATPGSCVSVPLMLGLDTPIYVTFYTTGIRNRSSDSAVLVTIGGQKVPVTSIQSPDDSTAMAGMDLVTVVLPLSLRGSGEVDVVVTVDGKSSNTGRINVQ